jgi:SAM-dependent methyltransferase
MQKRHQNRMIYFQEQSECTRKYVIPYIEQVLPVTPNLRILEIGCGEGGNLKPFLELGCHCVGVDIDVAQIEKAEQYLSEYYQGDNLTLIARNIYDVQPDEIGTFDIIMLRDVIEHIPNQEQFLPHLKDFMHAHTVVFFGFPVWCNPFGGHHQICRNKWLSHTPWLHLLPNCLYSKVLQWGGESVSTIKALLEIKATGISLHRFEQIIHKEQYKVLQHTHYLINPNYEIKFGLRPCVLPKCLQIPYLSDFYTTAMYYLIEKQ